MFATLLLAGLIAAPASTLALFAGRPIGRRRDAAWQWWGRLLSAMFATAVLVVAVAAGLSLIGTSRRHIVDAAAAVVVMSVIWLPVTRQWRAVAHACWVSTVLLFVAYLLFMVQWTFSSGLGLAGTVGSLVLWALEVWAALLGCAYLWELCDTMGRVVWRRRAPRGSAEPDPTGYEPFVTLHVPAFNEPAPMVIETLQSLRHLDYAHYEIVCVDDNSTDEELWRPVETWCRQNGVAFAHLENWPGYKAGALNYALEHLTDPRSELIGVVDADYQLDPSFLRKCVGFFADPAVGFIQAPQDYRDWAQAPFYRRMYYSYRYFFAVSQPSRNERDGAIFAGTTGLIRRRALEAVGGWDESCITEDAELSLRILRAGYSGQHVDRAYGHGIMPLTFEALKRQRFRWCFGGIQLLRQHWRSLLPGARTRDNQLTAGQRWAYLSGALQWYGDLLATVFFLFLLAGAANVALGGGLLFRKLTGFLVATIAVMAAMGLVRSVALLRQGAGATWRDALGAFLVWQSTTLVVARACVQGLFAREAEFLRTPKTSEVPTWFDAVRGNKGETLLALAGAAGIVAGVAHFGTYAGPLTAALLVWPTVAFGAAPVNSLAARRAALPPELQSRRQSEAMRTPAARPVTIAAGTLGIVGGAVAVLALLAPGPAVVAPQVVAPARGQAVHSSPASTSTTVGRVTPTTESHTATTVGATTSTTRGSSPTTSPPTSAVAAPTTAP